MKESEGLFQGSCHKPQQGSLALREVVTFSGSDALKPTEITYLWSCRKCEEQAGLIEDEAKPLGPPEFHTG